jgi:hypothetical protein
MHLEWASVISLVTGLVVIGGLGWKLATELAGIKTCLQVFIAKSEATEKAFDLRLQAIEKRVDKLEDK